VQSARTSIQSITLQLSTIAPVDSRSEPAAVEAGAAQINPALHPLRQRTLRIMLLSKVFQLTTTGKLVITRSMN
jgi:hypothetical protein